jgi:hypothetical protein
VCTYRDSFLYSYSRDYSHARTAVTDIMKAMSAAIVILTLTVVFIVAFLANIVTFF